MSATTAERKYHLLPDDAPAFYDAVTLAPVLGVEPPTVRWYRHRGTGPKGFRSPGGRKILYPAAEVDRWLVEARDRQLPDPSA